MDIRLQVGGWLVFVVCSLLFVVQNIIARDMWGLAASVTFLLGCLAFLCSYAVTGKGS